MHNLNTRPDHNFNGRLINSFTIKFRAWIIYYNLMYYADVITQPCSKLDVC